MTNLKDQGLTTPIKREKKVQIGSVELKIALDAVQAEKLRKSPLYRYLLQPALRRVFSSDNGHNGNGSGQYRAGMPALNAATLPTPATPATPEARAIIEQISGYEWYHTIELPHGVVTPGYVDHRKQLPYYHLPSDMTGMRVLDVATFDGFWAFEFERRGAEVVAIDLASTNDIDVPTNWREDFTKDGLHQEKGEGFRIASRLLGSNVKREVCSVYDVSPERLGTFDMVFTSDLLIHLRDPLHAMESIWTAVKPTGFAVFADVYHPQLDGMKDNALVEFAQAGKSDVWWRPSTTCYRLWLHLARFSRVEETSRFKLQSNYRSEIPKVVFHAYP